MGTSESIELSKSYEPKALLRTRMKPYWPVLILATVLTLLLSLVGALIGTAVGPSFKILSSANTDQVYLIKDLLGDNLGRIISSVIGLTQITGKELIERLPFALIVLAGLKAVFFLFQWYIWELTGEKISKNLRTEMFKGFLKLNPQYSRSEKGKAFEAELASGMSVDIKLLKEYMVRFYGGMPRELMQAVFLGFTLFLLSPRLFYIFFLGLLPVVAVIKRLGKIIRKRSEKALEDFSVLTEWLQQRLLGIETIKHYGTEALEGKKLEELTSGLLYRFYKSARAKAKSSPIIEAASVAAVGLVIYISLDDVKNGLVTGAVVMSFLATLALMGQSITRFGRYYNNNREASAAVSRIAKLLAYSEAHVHETVGLKHEKPNANSESQSLVLKVDQVSVVYPERKTIGLDDFSYSFNSGSIYCVCGRSGAGKSTLVNVLLGLFEPDSGNLAFSFDSSVMTSAQDHSKLVSYVPQDINLVPGTIAENIAYPSESNLDVNKIHHAIEKVGLTESIQSLEFGINSKVGLDGKALSGGQSQRLMLARLWYQNSKLIIIDEGTSALDPVNEKIIYQGLNELAAKGTIIILIAHRISTLEFADEVILLNEGRVAVSGEFQSIKSNPEVVKYLG